MGEWDDDDECVDSLVFGSWDCCFQEAAAVCIIMRKYLECIGCESDNDDCACGGGGCFCLDFLE